MTYFELFSSLSVGDLVGRCVGDGLIPDPVGFTCQCCNAGTSQIYARKIAISGHVVIIKSANGSKVYWNGWSRRVFCCQM